VPLEGENDLARLGVPQPHRFVHAARENVLAVGAERHTPHFGGLALEGENFLARRGIPHLRRPVIAGGKAFAVGAERHAPHTAFERCEGQKLLARGSVPHPGRARFISV
jgi:hypothetical protein